VTPDPSTAGSMKARISGDIFIPPHAVASSMHGDQVLIEVINVRDDGRAEGRIVRSLNRAHPTVVGIFHYGGRHNYVKAIDSKISQEIVIPKGEEYPEAISSVAPVPSVVPAFSNPAAELTKSKKSRHRVVGD